MSVEFLRATPLFQGLSDEELREVVGIFREENQRAWARPYSEAMRPATNSI